MTAIAFLGLVFAVACLIAAAEVIQVARENAEDDDGCD